VEHDVGATRGVVWVDAAHGPLRQVRHGAHEIAWARDAAYSLTRNATLVLAAAERDPPRASVLDDDSGGMPMVRSPSKDGVDLAARRERGGPSPHERAHEVNVDVALHVSVDAAHINELTAGVNAVHGALSPAGALTVARADDVAELRLDGVSDAKDRRTALWLTRSDERLEPHILRRDTALKVAIIESNVVGAVWVHALDEATVPCSAVAADARLDAVAF
jgi:hypothetical protein